MIKTKEILFRKKSGSINVSKSLLDIKEICEYLGIG